MACKTDLLLVNIGDKKQEYGNLRFSISAIEPPVWAGMIAAFVREKGFSVKVIDAEGLNYSDDKIIEIIADESPTLVVGGAVGSNPSASSTPKMASLGRLLREIDNKMPHIKTAVCGIHPSALPEITLEQEKVDFVFKGECYYSIIELLEELRSNPDGKDYDIKGLCYKNNGSIVFNGWGKIVEDVDILPMTAWDLLPMEVYRAHNWHCFEYLNNRQPYGVIYTSYGCPFNCSFCNIKAAYNGKAGIRYRSPKKVVDEIGLLVEKYGIKNIKFADEIFALKKDRVEEICDLIIEKNYDLNIWAYARVDTINRTFLKKMKRAGINWLAFGIESANKKVRDGVVKGQFGSDVIKNAIEMTHNAGIYIVANFIFGLVNDDMETMQETLDMAKALNCEYSNFYTTMAYPGSQLYDDLISEGVELPSNWLSYSQFSEETLPLSTKCLSSSEVLRFRDKAFNEYHSSSRYLNMIDKKFGPDVVEYIQNMLNYKIPRKHV